MGQHELPTSAHGECENCEQEEGGVSTDQTAEASTVHQGQHGQQGGDEEVRTEEHSSQVDDYGEDDGESDSGLWGHSPLPQHVHGNNPAELSKTRGLPNPVWELVRHIKSRYAHGTRIDCKWTHVCVAPITAKEAREEGDDVDSDGAPRWHCNSLFNLKLTPKGNCYRTSCVTEHVKRHGTNSEVGRSLEKRAAEGTALKSNVMEASASKSGHRSGAAALYTITSEQLCLGKMARW
jgi:hypothetical protein